MRYDTQNIFFISDLHISHKNIIKYDNRPYSDLEEMHVDLIKRWNEVVQPEDIVYYLGDLSFGRSDTAKWFVNAINGKISYIMGNHDNMKDIVKLGRWENVHEYGTEIFVKDEDNKKARGSQGYQQIVMSHYPILSWNREHHGSWMIHGHCHGSLMKSNQDYYKRKVLDVGCNCIDYRPISYGEIKNIMTKKEVSNIGHHGE